jgi:hypothetical protein
MFCLDCQQLGEPQVAGQGDVDVITAQLMTSEADLDPSDHSGLTLPYKIASWCSERVN